MRKVFYDTETVKFTGPVVLIQYAFDDGPVQLFHPWEHPVKETLSLIEEFMGCANIGFNLTFDHFHISRLYNLFSAISGWLGDRLPIGYVSDIAESDHPRMVKHCLKPPAVLDLYLAAIKGRYQTCMERRDITVRKVPNAIAGLLCKELNKRSDLPRILFSRYADADRLPWHVSENEKPGFSNVVLKFGASAKLKTIAADAFNLTDTIAYSDLIGPECIEVPYMPFYAVAKHIVHRKLSGYVWGYEEPEEPEDWEKYAQESGKFVMWPQVLAAHNGMWLHHEKAKVYATNDVVYTRQLYEHLGGPSLSLSDRDSRLAIAVANAQLKGFKLDNQAIGAVMQDCESVIRTAPRAPNAAREYLYEVMTPDDRVFITNTSKETLAEVREWPGEVGIRAAKIAEARKAEKLHQLLTKLNWADTVHFSFRVIGTKSGRMSGSGGINPQGINRDKSIRKMFKLAPSGYQASGGDAKSFEVVLAAHTYGDPVLTAELRSGKKLHGLLGQELFPDKEYEEIIEDLDTYSKSKSSVFAMLYGAMAPKLSATAGISLEEAESAYERFITKYTKVGEARKRVMEQFCSMSQPGGLRTKVVWRDPADFIESRLGFRRYFTLENRITKMLFDLADNMPAEWDKLKGICIRSDREQTIAGATKSSLFAAAFSLQASNMRAAANHVIQSSGAEIIKDLQCKLDDFQPVGIHDYEQWNMNVHDEVLSIHNPALTLSITQAVKDFEAEVQKDIVLFGMGWAPNITSWADKG